MKLKQKSDQLIKKYVTMKQFAFYYILLYQYFLE